MKNPLIRILFWLGIMAVCTLAAMGIWLIGWSGSQTTESLKWLQFLQTIGTLLLPAILGAWLWSEDHKPFAWLRMDRGMSWQTALLAIATMVCAIPAINLLADLNSRIVLPESMASIEQWLRQQEDAAAALTERFLKADNIGTLLINLGLLALLPALSEEITFRGTLQQIISPSSNRPSIVHRKSSNRQSTLAIWLTAFLFSAIHMQFYGFLPRMLMGAMFGYIFVWVGSLWVPVLMHATNNALAVLFYYILGDEMNDKTWADTIGTGSMWWLGIISLCATLALLYCLYNLSKNNNRPEERFN